MTMDWDSKQYLKFTDHRLRPAQDLINRINIEQPESICDLGCGPGNVTRLLAGRWPGAAITGIDSSPEMLSKAGEETTDINWVKGDIGTWAPNFAPHMIFSNAALHWLDDHQVLFPKLVSFLNPGGVLAVQMPRNHGAASHTLRDDVAAEGPWADLLAGLAQKAPVAEADFYYDLLAPQSRSIDIWESEYAQILEGDNPVLEWVRSTALKPYLDAFDRAAKPDWKESFIDQYAQRLNKAYPKRRDGRTLFAFKRLFMVCKK